MAPPPRRDPYVGVVLGGRYRIDTHLAKGGMGVVYRATQLAIEREVAIKIVRPDQMGGDPDVRARRFRREARVQSRLKHPNTVTLYDFGETPEGDLFIAMELIAGPTLEDVIAEGPLPVQRAIHIAVQVAQGLEEAHRLGIVHRDLKPANIMLAPIGGADGTSVAKIVDFGIARVLNLPDLPELDDPQLTLTGKLSGTPHYMSPEQVRGGAADERSDQYALGLILYEMLSGCRAVQGRTPVTALMNQLNVHPPPLRQVRRDLDMPPDLQRVLDRAIGKEPSARYPDLRAFRQALEAVTRREDLGALWASAEAGAIGVFDILLRHADRMVEIVVERVRGKVAAYRYSPRRRLASRVRFFLEWCSTPAPDESALVRFLDDEWRGRQGRIPLHEVLSAFGCVFPSIRALAEELSDDERLLLGRHWSTLEQHFWLLVRVLSARYEERAGTGRALTAALTISRSETQPMYRLESVPRGAAGPVDLESLALSALPAGVLVIESGSHRVRAVNPAMERIFGIDAGEIIGRRLEEALPELGDLDPDHIARIIEQHGELPPLELTVRGASGQRKWLQVRGAFAGGGPETHLVLAIDERTLSGRVEARLRRQLGASTEVSEALMELARSSESRREPLAVMDVGLVPLTQGGPAVPLRSDLPDDGARALRVLSAVVAEVVAAEGGWVDRWRDTSAATFFGFPRQTDDRAPRAVAAAHALIARLTDWPRSPLARRWGVGVGVASGPAVLAVVGPDDAPCLVASGSVLNRATRLRVAARHGQVLVDPSTGATLGVGARLTEATDGAWICEGLT